MALLPTRCVFVLLFFFFFFLVFLALFLTLAPRCWVSFKHRHHNRLFLLASNSRFCFSCTSIIQVRLLVVRPQIFFFLCHPCYCCYVFFSLCLLRCFGGGFMRTCTILKIHHFCSLMIQRRSHRQSWVTCLCVYFFIEFRAWVRQTSSRLDINGLQHRLSDRPLSCFTGDWSHPESFKFHLLYATRRVWQRFSSWLLECANMKSVCTIAAGLSAFHLRGSSRSLID